MSTQRIARTSLMSMGKKQNQNNSAKLKTAGRGAPSKKKRLQMKARREAISLSLNTERGRVPYDIPSNISYNTKRRRSPPKRPEPSYKNFVRSESDSLKVRDSGNRGTDGERILRRRSLSPGPAPQQYESYDDRDRQNQPIWEDSYNSSNNNSFNEQLNSVKIMDQQQSPMFIQVPMSALNMGNNNPQNQAYILLQDQTALPLGGGNQGNVQFIPVGNTSNVGMLSDGGNMHIEPPSNYITSIPAMSSSSQRDLAGKYYDNSRERSDHHHQKADVLRERERSPPVLPPRYNGVDLVGEDAIMRIPYCRVCSEYIPREKDLESHLKSQRHFQKYYEESADLQNEHRNNLSSHTAASNKDAYYASPPPPTSSSTSRLGHHYTQGDNDRKRRGDSRDRLQSSRERDRNSRRSPSPSRSHEHGRRSQRSPPPSASHHNASSRGGQSQSARRDEDHQKHSLQDDRSSRQHHYTSTLSSSSNSRIDSRDRERDQANKIVYRRQSPEPLDSHSRFYGQQNEQRYHDHRDDEEDRRRHHYADADEDVTKILRRHESSSDPISSSMNNNREQQRAAALVAPPPPILRNREVEEDESRKYIKFNAPKTLSRDFGKSGNRRKDYGQPFSMDHDSRVDTESYGQISNCTVCGLRGSYNLRQHMAIAHKLK